jgi:hypothetical protein
MSLLSFMKPASKSGASYADGLVIMVLPRLKGYSRKWNMVKNYIWSATTRTIDEQARLTLPGGMSMWSPNQPAMTE